LKLEVRPSFTNFIAVLELTVPEVHELPLHRISVVLGQIDANLYESFGLSCEHLREELVLQDHGDRLFTKVFEALFTTAITSVDDDKIPRKETGSRRTYAIHQFWTLLSMLACRR
jgi:hypothetical protein